MDPTIDDLKYLSSAEAISFLPKCDGIYRRNAKVQKPVTLPDNMSAAEWAANDPWARKRVVRSARGSGVSFMTVNAIHIAYGKCCDEGTWATAAAQKKISIIVGCCVKTVKRGLKALRSGGLIISKWRYTKDEYGRPRKTTSISTMSGFFRAVKRIAKKKYNEARPVKPATSQGNPYKGHNVPTTVFKNSGAVQSCAPVTKKKPSGKSLSQMCAELIEATS